MKIVHIITRLLRAGSEENTIANCLYQAEQGHEVWLVHGDVFDPKHYEELGGKIKLVELRSMVHPLHPAKDLRATLDFAKLCREIRPDVINTHQSKAGIIGRFGGRLGRVPVIIHGIHIAPFVGTGKAKDLIYTTIEKAAASSTTAFISVSEGMRDSFLDRKIGKTGDHFVVHSGMDIAKFHNPELPEDWRALVNLGDGDSAEKPPVILMLAAHEPRKRHVELIEAFRQVLAQFPDAVLLLGGQGPLFEEVSGYIAAQGLERNVKCLGHRKDAERLIALADICVLSSSQEGLPRVVVQYVAGGKPVVVADLPGISEIVRHGENGIVTSAADVAEMGPVMTGLLQDRTELERLAAGSRAFDTSSWSTEAMCRKVEAICQQQLDASQGRSSRRPVKAA